MITPSHPNPTLHPKPHPNPDPNPDPDPKPDPNPNPNPDPNPDPEQEFHGITLIEDAYTLWAKMKAERGVADWNPELDEEFEDRQGNVMNRKTYTDLARQGLLD